MSNDEKLRYPVGRFSPKDSYSTEELQHLINSIAILPVTVEALINKFNAQQLDTPYREGGWTARQVVHHLADSHMNAYIRFKWTLTEDTPLIKAYDEAAWAETPEVKSDPLISLNLLKALHIKWVTLLEQLTPAQLAKQFLHPETKKHISLERMVATYAWHGEHHLGHLQIISNK